jgi:hypothetical protein
VFDLQPYLHLGWARANVAPCTSLRDARASMIPHSSRRRRACRFDGQGALFASDARFAVYMAGESTEPTYAI